MSNVDLNALKINHDANRPQKRSAPLLVLLLLFVAGAVLGGLGVYLWSTGHDDTAQVDVQPAEDEQEESTPEDAGDFWEGGWVEVPSYHPIIASALTPGRLERLHVVESARVKKGDLLAELYQADLQDARDAARAELRAAEARLARLTAGFRMQEVEAARAAVREAEAARDLAQRVLTRTESLLDSGAVSAEELERDRATFATQEARVQVLHQDRALKEEGSRQEDIDAAEAEVARRRALSTLAEKQLEYTRVQSPADGIVLERFVSPGTYISRENPRIVSLYDPMDLQVRVDVRQENIRRVFVGQEAAITSEVETKVYSGRVIRIDPLADFKKNTIQVKLKILDPSEHLYPEMIVRVQFKESSGSDSDG